MRNSAIREQVLSETTSREAVGAPFAVPDPVTAAEVLLRKYAARAIGVISGPRTLPDGRTVVSRISANDCYAALEESLRKMARVAVRNYSASPVAAGKTFELAVDSLFPDPVAYLVRCIYSVIRDAERLERRVPATISLDAPIAGAAAAGDTGLCLADALADHSPASQPEDLVIEQDEREAFRRAFRAALSKIPANYLAAIQRDIERERRRDDDQRVEPETDRERQTVCRARAALATLITRECGPDNIYIQILARQRTGRVRQRSPKSALALSAAQQSDLMSRLLASSWRERAAAADHPEANVDEAVVNELSVPGPAAPPSPEMREAMRVMDTYTLGDNPRARDPEAQALYEQAQAARRAGNPEAAAKLYRQAWQKEPEFVEAYNEVGVMLSQMGNLRDALTVYLEIVESSASDDHRLIAATNAADIYLTWYDAGRNREANLQRAAWYARLAMERPTPMRACNLILAYVKDHYYREARDVMDVVLQNNTPECRAERFLQTLFQIRDADLVRWLGWLQGELGEQGINR